MHRSTVLDNDQLDAQLLYFTIRLLCSSTCFEHYMLIIRRLNCIEAASAIVSLCGVPRNFVRGCSTNSVEDRGQRERGSGGGSPIVRGSEGSCNLVQEISFHTVKFS